MRTCINHPEVRAQHAVRVKGVLEPVCCACNEVAGHAPSQFHDCL